jgi:hypothetical protein
MNEQTLKEIKEKHDRERQIAKCAERAKAQKIAEQKARLEFNNLMKERGVVL